MRSESDLRVLYDVSYATLRAPTGASSATQACRVSALNRFLIGMHALPVAPIALRDADCSRQLLAGWDHVPQAAYLAACWIYRDMLIRRNFYCQLDQLTRRFAGFPILARDRTQSNFVPAVLTHQSLQVAGCHYLMQLCAMLPDTLSARLALMLRGILGSTGLATAVATSTDTAAAGFSGAAAAGCGSHGIRAAPLSGAGANSGDDVCSFASSTLPAPDKSLISLAIAYAKKYPAVLPDSVAGRPSDSATSLAGWPIRRPPD